MTDRIAEQGAVQYAQENPVSSGVSRLGAAGSLQAAIADALSGGRSSLNGSRLGGNGRIYALAASAGPMFLFQNSEQGVWYDPSDFSTLYQDSAGTTAAVVGQPVGLVLDKSKGLVIGPELVTNGTFDSGTTGWAVTAGGASIASVSGELQITAGAGGGLVAYTISTVIGKTYKLEVTGRRGTYTQPPQFGFGTTSTSTPTQLTFTTTSNVSKQAVYTATGTTTYVLARFPTLEAGATIYFDNISVKELPGYHATQATSTTRGVLGASMVDLDGADDSVSIATGAGGGSTGFFLCAAVRPDGGAGANRVIYSDAGTNTGYILRLNTSNQLELAAGNGTTYTIAATTDTLTVGTTYLVTAWDDGTNLNVQVNSGTVGTAARPVVSAGNADARIGKDYGAATGWFNGAIYPLIYVKNGENVGAADRTAVKAYVAGKAGVTL